MWQMQEQIPGIFMRCRDTRSLGLQILMRHPQEWDAEVAGEEAEGEGGGEGEAAGRWRWGRVPRQGGGGRERR